MFLTADVTSTVMLHFIGVIFGNCEAILVSQEVKEIWFMIA